jgi:hypothetical protein
VVSGLAYALLAEEARQAQPSSALHKLRGEECADAAHASLSVYLTSVEDGDTDIVADIVQRSGPRACATPDCCSHGRHRSRSPLTAPCLLACACALTCLC